MKRWFRSAALAAALMFLLPLSAEAAQQLIPVGTVIGLQLQDDTVTVAAFDKVCGMAARDAGLEIGDEILKINGMEIDCTGDVRSALDTCDGQLQVTVRRGKKENTLLLTPEETDLGPRLGVYLRQGISGIGTVTFFDPMTGQFGTLGHGVSSGTGQLLKMKEGYAYEACIGSVIQGKAGNPGQLKGSADPENTLGTLQRNTPQGVFGTTTRGWTGQAIPVARFEEVTAGPATIRCTVSSEGVREYSVEILKIYPRSRNDSRSFLIRVTDPQLLAATGGIVQGMSGSPVLQDGKIIGAVTHVLVNDPTTGYGIFIENMLDAAS